MFHCVKFQSEPVFFNCNIFLRIETDFVSDEVHDNRYGSKKWNLVLKTLILIRKIKVIPVWPCVHLYEECKIYNFFYQKFASCVRFTYGYTQTLIHGETEG